MPQVTVTFPSDIEEKLLRLGDKTDEIMESVLQAGGEVVLKRVQSNLNSVLSGKSTGELAGALGLSPVKVNRKGVHDIKIGFSEPRRGKGKSNAKVATVLEYGRSGQPPRPFMKPAKSQSRGAAVAAMEQKFNDEVNKV
jgi:HK97 gp10 family phage protein